MHFCLQVFAFQMISHTSLKSSRWKLMSSVNRIFLKRFYLASTGRTRIWMVFKRALLLFQLLEYKGENVHKHTHKHTHMYVCVCRISRFQFLFHKSLCARPQNSIFGLYLIPILYHSYYISHRSSCIYLREAAMLTDIVRISKSHRRKYYNSAGNGVTHLSIEKGWLYCMLSLWALLSVFLTFGCVFLCSQSFKEVRSQCLKSCKCWNLFEVWTWTSFF